MAPNLNQAMFDFSVIREIRKAKGLTIENVSQQSGVSISVISKLERNQTIAELETLFRISRVFGLNTTDLLSLAESRTAHGTKAKVYKSGDFDFSTISYANAQCFHGYAPKGGRVSRPEMHHDDYEICWVLKGKICITLPHETHILGPGDAVQFDAILTHTYESLENTELLIIHLNKGKRF